MSYLLAIFLPPIYFATRKKWVATCVTSFLFFLSLCFWLAIPVFWFLSAICSVWDLRKAVMHEHAEVLGKRIAANMNLPAAK